MKEILAGIALLFIAIIDMVQSAFIYAGCSTLIGIIIFIACIAVLGGWGLISLVFILPFIINAINRNKMYSKMQKDDRDNDMPF